MILAIVACVIDYSQKVDDFVEHKAPFLSIVVYFLNFIPSIVALLYPLFIFIATIFFTSKMAYRSEIIASLSAGISFQRFLLPYFMGAILFGIVSLLANHWIVPMGNRNIYNFKTQYVWNKKPHSGGSVHLRLSPHEYVYVQNFNFIDNKGELFTIENFNGTLLTEKTEAEKIAYNKANKTWTLHKVFIRINDGLKETLIRKDSLVKKLDLVPDDFDSDDRGKESLTSPQLHNYAQKELRRGSENVNAYLFELDRRTSDAVAGIILTIIAACIASRRIRGGSGFHLAIGILLSAVYILFMQFSKTFSINSGINPLACAWAPNVIFAFVAFYLYRQRVR